MSHSMETRVLSLLLAVVMVFGMLPMSGFFTPAYAQTRTTGVNLPDGMDVISDEMSTLAPGVTLNEIALYDANGDRVEMYVTTVDTTVDTVSVYANYKDNQNASYGLQTLSEQVAAIEASHEEPFKVVAGINASYYNTSTGKPTGAFVMEGIDVTNEAEGNKYSFFAVLNDGTYMVGSAGEYSDYKGQIKEAIGGWIHLVKDGAICSGLDAKTKYPRQTLGLTEDGKLILMTADGSQAPQTIGLTIQEQAEVMLAMGCVEAIHLDGGNSATFGAVREGTDEFVLVNTPSGGIERAVSNTLMIVSTKVADGAFDHAIISGEYEYFAPHSTYVFSAKGVDASGGAADETPESVTWALSDSSFGTIEDGVFVSNGTLGSVDIQMVYNGSVVGSKSISVVDPISISFDAKEKTVPYAKTADLKITAMYGLQEMYCPSDAFTFAIETEGAGTMNDFSFTATEDDSISQTVVTATYKHSTALDPISVTVKFGKGSEVIYDFENKDVTNWVGADAITEWITEKNAEILEQYPDAKYTVLDTPSSGNGCGTKTSSTFLATEENGGKVKHGENALGLTLNRVYDEDVGEWSYNYLFYTGDTQIWRDLTNGKNATKIGMWMYLPEEAAGLYARICRTFTKDASGKLYTNYDYLYVGDTRFSQFTEIPEDGWVYAEFDLTSYNFQSSLQFNPYEDYAANNGKGANSNYYPGFLQFFVNTYDMEAEYVTIYIDDITLDYSDVTEDRDAPKIDGATVSTSADSNEQIKGQTVANNCLTFFASVSETTGTNNYTGLDYSTAQIYIDGMEMSDNSGFSASDGMMYLRDIYLNNGTHEVVFEIADKQGNYTRLTKILTVNGAAGNATVTVSGHNDSNNVPKAGSVYYLDVIASDVSQVSSIATSLKLQTANTFELDHIMTADGVSVEYDYDHLNNTLTLDIINNSELEGEAILVSIPVRVWSWSEDVTGVSANTVWANGNSPIVYIQCETTQGCVTYIDGALDAEYVTGFYANVNVATEVDDATKWHVHTEYALDDVDADCTHDGYTGRTYCDVCASIVEWGTAVLATGHNYELDENNLLACNCGEKFTGIWADGKTYNDGVCKADGWDGESYYLDGIKLTGIQCVSAPDGSGEFYYDFGENGVCVGQAKHNGLFYDEANKAYRYAKLGVLSSGWFTIDGEWYYFEEDTMNAATGVYQYTDDIVYEFADNGRLTTGYWAKTLYGYRYYYGPGYYKNSWYTIDGKDYCFENGYRIDGGYQCVFENQVNANWYYFQEDGSCNRDEVIPDGFYTDRNGTGYSVNGASLQGVHKIEGVYYYFNTKGYAQTGEYGGYLFGKDYKGFTGLVEKNGTLRYYENGKPCVAGLVKIDGAYYFAKGSNGEIAVGETCYVWQGNGIIPESNREFGADGKMLDGIVERDGVLYYYNMGQAGAFGLVEIDGAYYFAKGSNGEIAVGEACYVWQGNGIVPESTREFGTDGKMLDGIVERDGDYFYYEMGQPKMAGLICIDGAYYFAKDGNGTLVTDRTYYVWQANGLLPEGNYQFDEQGKMRNGIVDINGTLYYYEGGRPKLAGLVEIDGDYYFANGSNGEIAVGKSCYVWQGNGIIPESTREFGVDGKMLDGIVEKDGTLYYYVMGQPKLAGLVEVDGAYYFANGSRGEIAVSTTCYVWQGNGIIPESTREFGADGKMLNGIVEKSGTLCYYVMGVPKTAGLVEVDGAYYFAKGANGEIAIDETCYVWQGNGIVPESNREFGADGKMLNGFVTKEDGIYYYENGKIGTVGLNYIDGYYYFVGSDGKLVTSRTYYVWKTNGLCIAMNYTFDEMGRAII